MESRIKLGDITVDVVRKSIKNIHLSVYPPTGSVRISAPKRLSLDNIRVFALSKLGWIKKQQKKVRDQERETRREYIDRESHYLWGERYLLKIEEVNKPPCITLKHRKMILCVRPGAALDKKQDVVAEWYRDQVKVALPDLIAKWERIMGVTVHGCTVRKMKTRWGSCSPASGKIRINTELVRKPPECLEYILVHEMAHLIEPSHNRRFIALMDQYVPKWKLYKDELNHLPVRHEEWEY